jgi:hypothetical protein
MSLTLQGEAFRDVVERAPAPQCERRTQRLGRLGRARLHEAHCLGDRALEPARVEVVGIDLEAVATASRTITSPSSARRFEIYLWSVDRAPGVGFSPHRPSRSASVETTDRACAASSASTLRCFGPPAERRPRSSRPRQAPGRVSSTPTICRFRGAEQPTNAIDVTNRRHCTPPSTTTVAPRVHLLPHVILMIVSTLVKKEDTVALQERSKRDGSRSAPGFAPSVRTTSGRPVAVVTVLGLVGARLASASLRPGGRRACQGTFVTLGQPGFVFWRCGPATITAVRCDPNDEVLHARAATEIQSAGMECAATTPASALQ